MKQLVNEIRTVDPSFLRGEGRSKRDGDDENRIIRLRKMIGEDFDELDEVFRALA